MKYDCLIIDDELEIASGVCEYFDLFGVRAHYVLTSEEALSFLRSNTVGLILLDVNLGQDSGFTLCKTLRETLDIPILFVSARTSNEDMLLGLGIGGDDYITKPYSLSVLLAKVKAILKRYSSEKEKSKLQIDAATARIYLNNAPLELKNMEYKLLKYLMDNKINRCSQDRIIQTDSPFCAARHQSARARCTARMSVFRRGVRSQARQHVLSMRAPRFGYRVSGTRRGDRFPHHGAEAWPTMSWT